MSDPRAEIVERFHKNRVLAHAILFKGVRHQNETPPFHEEMIRDCHSGLKQVCVIAFRGSGKSTVAEEAMTLMACFREFRHGLIVGANLAKACERLHSIRRQFEGNAQLIDVFGNLRGQPWGDEKIELRTGITIQALGRGQAIRGTKNEDVRPDFILADDIEDAESVRTPEGREKVSQWFFGELLPSGDEPRLRVRVLANDMHPEAIANQLKREGAGFVVRIYPWVWTDEKGEEHPAWPDRFPLEFIERRRRQLYSLGRAGEYQREYMCHSESPEEKPFKRDMLRVEATYRSWQAVYCALDPARSLGRTAADTGFAAWSWLGTKLVVWDAWGRQLLPDAIVSALFEANETYRPVTIGIDMIGLSEFLAQPLRAEQVKRGETLPTIPLPAPKAKSERIRALQPFFNAREVIFAKPLPDLQAQLLGFPSGKRDILDALAYSLQMRAGAPVYEDFTQGHIVEDLRPAPGLPFYLALNASHTHLAVSLLQLVQGGLRIYWDELREGEPAMLVKEMIQSATMEAGRGVRAVCEPHTLDRYALQGLAAALRKLLGDNYRPGGDVATGRAELRSLLRQQRQGMPALLISTRARWTLNGFAGGYARALLKGGQLADHAVEGIYRVLLEGVESFAALLRLGLRDEEDEESLHYEYTRDGRRYLSARART